MRNIEIVERAITTLAEEGVIMATEGIYTKNAWRRQGYKVNKEESPIITLPIFVFAPKRACKEETLKKGGRMLCVRANFYKMSQVTKIEKGGKCHEEWIGS